MKNGYLSDFFVGIGAKRLTPTEIDPKVSNQHEFQGVHRLKTILGTPQDKIRFNVIFMRLTDDDDNEDFETVESFATWSDVRRDNPNRAAEYHLYYSSDAGPLVQKSSPGDLLVVAKHKDGSLAIIICENNSTIEKQVQWLFGIGEETDRLKIKDFTHSSDELELSSRLILHKLGVEVDISDDNWLGLIIDRFGHKFPPTTVFSKFARETLPDIRSTEDPDLALISWISHEEMLFKTLEKYFVQERLNKGFSDVDDFVSFSLSIQNRRKSRMGHALENHIEQVFNDFEIKFSRGKKTENNSKPDFIFPGIEYYHMENFSSSSLTMLGVKSTCKDRWRQVLSEAKRIKNKHLFTLESSISFNQTEEMKVNNLTLVIPEAFHETFLKKQRESLFSFFTFLKYVRSKQV